MKGLKGKLIVVMLAAAAGLAALTMYARAAKIPAALDVNSQKSVAAEEQTPTDTHIRKGDETPVAATVAVFKPTMSSGTDIKFEKSMTPLPSNADPKVFALNAYLRELPQIPKEAHVSSVTVKDGIADIVLNALFPVSFGMSDEKAVLDGICTTMGQFSDVKSVRLFREDQLLDTLGHADLTDPLPVMKAN